MTTHIDKKARKVVEAVVVEAESVAVEAETVEVVAVEAVEAVAVEAVAVEADAVAVEADAVKNPNKYKLGEIKKHPSFTLVRLVKETGNTFNDPNTFLKCGEKGIHRCCLQRIAYVHGDEANDEPYNGRPIGSCPIAPEWVIHTCPGFCGKDCCYECEIKPVSTRKV